MKQRKIPVLGTWLNYKKKTVAEWLDFFQKFINAGFSDYFINGSAKELKYLINLTKQLDINIHGWIWVMNRPNDPVAMKNPNWYSVNRKGESSFDFRPYVDYYQWLSPFSNGARSYVKKNILEIAKIKGIASVHLDYIRYCDVILPSNLQKYYRIKQEREMPEYDFGYHKNARAGFKKKYGIDPINMDFSKENKQWNLYRLDALTSLVKELKEIAKKNQTKISAAVFPYPEMSRQMVRHDWSSWELDITCPMNYHHFYEGDLNWIRDSVFRGLKSKKTKSLFLSGLFLGSLSPVDLKKAIIKCLEAGADGVSLFSADSLTNDHIKVLKSF